MFLVRACVYPILPFLPRVCSWYHRLVPPFTCFLRFGSSPYSVSLSILFPAARRPPSFSLSYSRRVSGHNAVREGVGECERGQGDSESVIAVNLSVPLQWSER